jgi:hypothetical protein
MTNLMITQGCTGTYSIIDVLGDHFNFGRGHGNINHHCRNPNLDPDRNISFEGSRLAYIFCNPYDYTISSFNRGVKFNEVHNRPDQCNGDHEYFRDREGQSLKEYLEDPHDAYYYREHAEGYLNNPDRAYDLLFLKYESLDLYGIKPLLSFWEVNMDPLLYKFKKRKSDWTQQPQEIKDLLHKKYGATMDWYQSLPLLQKLPRLK